MSTYFDYPKIGERIKMYRKQKKLTQRQLAELIDKTESSIRKYEKGLIEIPNIVLLQISDALDIKAWLLLGMNDKEAYDELTTYLFIGDFDIHKDDVKLGKLLTKAFGEEVSNKIAVDNDFDITWLEDEQIGEAKNLNDYLKKEGLNDSEIDDIKRYIEFVKSKRTEYFTDLGQVLNDTKKEKS
jgi:transcriptional regulator with XRE-family HTH domain